MLEVMADCCILGPRATLPGDLALEWPLPLALGLGRVTCSGWVISKCDACRGLINICMWGLSSWNVPSWKPSSM